MYELTFERLPTGRTHQVNGVYETILGADGEPETEFALCAIVDGHRVPLETYSVGYVEHMVGREDTAVDSGSSSSEPASSGQPAAAADEGDTATGAAGADPGAESRPQGEPPATI